MKHRTSLLHIALCMTTCLLATAAHANNIQVSNPMLMDNNNASGYVNVQFDISWENSWRRTTLGTNWDAAWIFIKYKDAYSGQWRHARLHGNAGHNTGTGMAANIATGLLNDDLPFNASTNPGVGVFLHRSANGAGTFAQQGVKVRWNYAQNGITYTDIAQVRVFAIEMVYVNQGDFKLGKGSGDRDKGHFYRSQPLLVTPPRPPYPVTSEDAIPVAPLSGGLYYDRDCMYCGESGCGYCAKIGDKDGPIPAAFPKGYAAFYMMKHEMAQQQYVDFLNTLTRLQQNVRTSTYTDLSPGITSVIRRYVMPGVSSMFNSYYPGVMMHRNGIRCDSIIPASSPIVFYCDMNGNNVGNEADDGQSVACTHLNWSDLTAYLDWSGLRPMTELEYVKACSADTVLNEDGYDGSPVYSWGRLPLVWTSQGIAVGNAGRSDEAVINTYYHPSNGLAVYHSMIYFANYPELLFGRQSAPLRVGIFAAMTWDDEYGAHPSSSSASAWGVLDLTGNVMEQAVSVGHPDGRAYTGTHGDGTLNTNGQHNVTAWPTSVGYGTFGGNYASSLSDNQLSCNYRGSSTYTYPLDQRFATYGGRGVRSAP